jgi:hypothetical protein
MTGIRLWTDAVTAFGVVVRIEQDLTHCPLGSFQRSHSPANANNSPSLTSKQYGYSLTRKCPKNFAIGTSTSDFLGFPRHTGDYTR